MNAIAFCLYGSDKRYLIGALRNAEQAQVFYPGWKVVCWVDAAVPGHIVDNLQKTGAILNPIPLMFRNKMLSRLLIHDLPGLERYIVRDVDSRFSVREAQAVQEWMQADTRLHIMRDHPYHLQAIMGGMWGWKKSPADFQMLLMIKLWFKKPMRPGEDQDFLREHIYSMPVTRTVHDSCGTFDSTRNWPPTVPGFVGEYIDENEMANDQHRMMRFEWLKRHPYDYSENHLSASPSGPR